MPQSTTFRTKALEGGVGGHTMIEIDIVLVEQEVLAQLTPEFWFWRGSMAVHFCHSCWVFIGRMWYVKTLRRRTVGSATVLNVRRL